MRFVLVLLMPVLVACSRDKERPAPINNEDLIGLFDRVPGQFFTYRHTRTLQATEIDSLLVIGRDSLSDGGIRVEYNYYRNTVKVGAVGYTIRGNQLLSEGFPKLTSIDSFYRPHHSKLVELGNGLLLYDIEQGYESGYSYCHSSCRHQLKTGVGIFRIEEGFWPNPQRRYTLVNTGSI